MRRWLWLLVMVSMLVTVFSMDDQLGETRHSGEMSMDEEEVPRDEGNHMETKAETKSSINLFLRPLPRTNSVIILTPPGTSGTLI